MSIAPSCMKMHKSPGRSATKTATRSPVDSDRLWWYLWRLRKQSQERDSLAYPGGDRSMLHLPITSIPW